jgi:tRNA (guanine-N7-)-methyltransferase
MIDRITDERSDLLVPEADEKFAASIPKPICLEDLFSRRQPVEVDLGSGPGKFLIEAAQQYPERNFLGIERLLGRVRKIQRRATEAGLSNLRVLRFEIEYSVRYLLPAGSISRVHIYFPDPWPKRRHHRRRLLGWEFLRDLARAVGPGGEVLIKTDHEDYFQRIQQAATGAKEWSVQSRWVTDDYPLTDFERAFLADRVPIYRLRLDKVTAAP